MFIDSSDVPSGSVIETDICIVGTGPASAASVGELSDAQVRSVLLESAGLTPDIKKKALSIGIDGNRELSPLDIRGRQFGGTANKWGHKVGGLTTLCRFTPFDDIDFEYRDWLPYSGWPFDRNTLDPYYRRASVACGLGPFAYDGNTWERPEIPQLHFPGDRLVTTVFQFGPRELQVDTLKQIVNTSKALTCYLNATVVQLESDATGQAVECVEVAIPNGNRFRVKADTFVLAAGGIENARLLLLSNQTQPRGLGNRNDLVGRFFMDHYMIHY